jgi:hypothetical protein
MLDVKISFQLDPFFNCFIHRWTTKDKYIYFMTSTCMFYAALDIKKYELYDPMTATEENK